MSSSLKNKPKILYQIQKLRRLAQPFFLPIDQCNGTQFIWLLLSLLFCVGGIVLVALTGLISLFESLQPILLEKYFGGVVNTVNFIWESFCFCKKLITSPFPYLYNEADQITFH